MELSTPEKILFEADVYEIDDDLRIKKGTVRITENRLLFKNDENAKLLYISGVQMIEIKKENKWGFLVGGGIFLLSSAMMYLTGVEFGIKNFISAFLYFVAPTFFLFISLLLLYWWFVTRSYLLELVTEFGKKVRIRSKEKNNLVEIANAIELIKIGAVRMLQRRERSFI